MMKLAFAFLLVLLLTDMGSSRLIKENVVMISDGIYSASQKVAAPTVTCEPAYGFLPCTSDLWGHLFLIVVYQYLLSLGQKYVSEGSDLFFTAFGPGIFGASFFHFLGTIPQVALILVSRLSGDPSNAQAQAGIGMSLLAGSAVLNLTLIWGTAVALGSHGLSEEPNSSQVEHKKTGFGVTTDVDTSYTARIMIISIVPLLILQLTKIVRSSSGSQWIVLISLIVTLAILFSYVLYQTFQPWIQNRRFEYLTLKFAKDKLLRVLLVGGKPNEPLIREIFHEIDRNKNSHISTAELRLLILGIQIEDDGFIRADYAEKFREMFDISGDDNIDEEEFVKGMSKWLVEAKKSVNRQDQKIPNNNTEEGQSLLVQRKKTLRSEDAWRTYTKAAYFLVLGTAISALLALPLIQSVVGFVTLTNIPSFFIPYVVIPLTLSFRTAKQTITSARQKTSNSISLTLSQIYGSVFMSNMIGLVTFLIVVYVRELPVGSSAEFLVAIVTITLMGAYTSFKTDFSRWASYVAILMYPISLFVLYVLTTVLGWS